jgi:hypothetical protein
VPSLSASEDKDVANLVLTDGLDAVLAVGERVAELAGEVDKCSIHPSAGSSVIEHKNVIT